MILYKESPLTGKLHCRELDISEDEYRDYLNGNECIQDAFPHLSREDSEFILTGITPEEWRDLPESSV